MESTLPQQTWILLDFAKRLTAKPAPRTVASRPLVTYVGDDKTLYVAHDACPHRGAALHRGTVRGRCVVCPYHAQAVSPARHADRFIETALRDGLVWVDAGLGQEGTTDPAAPASYPEFTDPAYRTIEYSKTVPVNPVLMTENTLDWQHLSSVHRFALVDGDPEVAVRQTGPHGLATYRYTSPAFDLTIENEYHIPFTTSLRFKFTDEKTGEQIPPLLLWFSLTPLDAGRCELNLRISRATATWLPWITDAVFKLIDELPLFEDVEIVQTVDPAAWSANRLTPGDAFVKAYREAMQAHCHFLLRDFVV